MSPDRHSRVGMGRRAVLTLLANIIGGVCGYASLFFMYRFIGDTAPGILAFGLSYIGLITIFSDLGYGAAHMKRVSEGKDISRCVGVFTLVRLMLTSVFLVAGVIGYLLMKSTRMGLTLSPFHEQMVHILLGYQALILLSDVLRITFAARLETAKATLPPIVENIVRMAAIVSIAVNHSLTHSMNEQEVSLLLGYAYLLGALAYALTAFMFLRGLKVRRPTMAMFRSYTRFAMPVMLAMAGGLILVNTDKFMLQIFWGTEEVSHYFGVQKVAMIITYVGTMISGLIFPLMSGYVSTGETGRVGRVVSISERYLSMAAMVAVIPLVAVPSQIIHVLLSDDLLPVSNVLSVLAVFSYLMVINVPYRSVFGSFNRPVIGTKITGANTALNLVLNLVLIPSSLFGVGMLGMRSFGAAISTIASLLVTTFLVRYAAYRLSGTWLNTRVLLHVGGGVASILALSFLSGVYAVTRFYDLILFGLVGTGIYMGILSLLRELRKEDLRLLRSILHPGKMLEYLRREVLERNSGR